MRHIYIYALTYSSYFVLSLNFASVANHYVPAMKLDEDVKTEEVEKEVNEDREDSGVKKEAVPSRRESVSSGRETVGSLSGSRLSLRSQLSLTQMSEKYLDMGALFWQYNALLFINLSMLI